MLPGGLQPLPLVQVLPLLQVTPVEDVVPTPPQHRGVVLLHEVPVNRQPPTGWQTVAPDPGSKQVREQHPVPSEQGLPAWSQPPEPPPEVALQMPAPPSLTVQVLLQHSALSAQRSLVG